MLKAFPKKRISAGGLLTNVAGELLIVKPVYREGWLLPGGVVDVDESPAAALAREIKEELGLAVQPGKLLCVDYTSGNCNYDEGVNFTFDCGTLSEEIQRSISLCPIELLGFQFVTFEQALPLLVPSIARRLQYLRYGYAVYLEDGVLETGQSAKCESLAPLSENRGR